MADGAKDLVKVYRIRFAVLGAKVAGELGIGGVDLVGGGEIKVGVGAAEVFFSFDCQPIARAGSDVGGVDGGLVGRASVGEGGGSGEIGCGRAISTDGDLGIYGAPVASDSGKLSGDGDGVDGSGWGSGGWSCR